MDFYDLIEYLAESSCFEKMLFRTPITSTVELFVTLANSCHKQLHRRCCKGSCSLVSKPGKNYDRGLGHDQYHLILFLYIIYYIGCLTVNKVGSINPVKCSVGFEPKPSNSILFNSIFYTLELILFNLDKFFHKFQPRMNQRGYQSNTKMLQSGVERSLHVPFLSYGP